MRFARKLFEIAKKQRPTAVEPYVNELVNAAHKRAKDGHYVYKATYKSGVAEIKEDLANRLYAEGFGVVTKHFPTIGDLDIVLSWDREEPRKPVHHVYS